LTDVEIKNIMSEEFIETTYLYCYKRLSNHTEAEDLSQEILLEALKAMRSGRADELTSFYSWYWKMAHNRYCIFLKKRSGQAVSLEVFGGSMPSDMKPLDADLIAKEEISELNYAISRLSKIQRDVVVLFYLNENKVEDIAKRLDISVGTVKRRLFDARQNIKKGVEKMNNNKAGKFSYAPAQCEITMSGCFPTIPDRISEQVLVVCRDKGMTVQEIADEIGVAPVYLEEKLEYLFKIKLLKVTPNGKYITDFLVFPVQPWIDFHYEKSLIYKNIGEDVTQAVLAAKAEILSLDFYGKDFEYNYLMWVLYEYASQTLSNMMLRKYNKKWEGKIPENNGKDYTVQFVVTMPDEVVEDKKSDVGAIYWSNLGSGYTTPNYSHVLYTNLFDAEPFGDRNASMVGENNINTVMKIYDDPAAKLTAVEEEQAANLIADGLVSKKDGKLYLNMPVMTWECNKKINAILEKHMEHLIDKYVDKLSELGEKYLLPLVREDLMEEFAHCGMRTAFYPLNYVFYYGMYAAKTLAIPDDYTKSAAGLCIYITK